MILSACPKCNGAIVKGACYHIGDCGLRLTFNELNGIEEARVPTSQVDHPTHYNEHPSGIECVTIAEHMGFNIGNAIKYLWRAGRKNETPTDDDLRKAIWYIERERERLKKVPREPT